MVLEAFEPSPLPFSFSHHHAETRTHKEAVARVDACKWDGRGRRQNCGKLKLMNNRPPLPLFAPRPLLLLRNAGTRWKIVVEQRGVRLEYDGNDDITMTRNARRYKSARVVSFLPSSPPLLHIVLRRHLFRVLLQATNAFLTSSPWMGFSFVMNYADRACQRERRGGKGGNCLRISLLSARRRYQI